MKFSKLGKVGKGPGKGPIHPIEIFEKLPSLPGSPNDLWRGQAEALNGWHDARTEEDVLIALNTGAGKTLIGVLTAQSLVNEGVENVVYVCATIDLVRQTSAEATKIGLPHTIRVEQGYDNGLFEAGKSFCITTYQALFNGRSSIRRKHFPGAVIFDDAHVSESVLRDAFTLRIDGRKEPALMKSIAELFAPHFREVERFCYGSACLLTSPKSEWRHWDIGFTTRFGLRNIRNSHCGSDCSHWLGPNEFV